MCQAAELVRELLPRLVLKRVRVHRVELEAAPGGELSQVIGVVWFVPRDVQRHGGRHSHQLKDGRAIVELLVNVARLARAGKTCEARPARADAPRRHGDAKGLRASDERFDVYVAASQLAREMLVIFI